MSQSLSKQKWKKSQQNISKSTITIKRIMHNYQTDLTLEINVFNLFQNNRQRIKKEEIITVIHR